MMKLIRLMNKIEIKMTVAETFERNLKKEKRLKELWNVSDNFLLGWLKCSKPGRYSITSIQKGNGEILIYPNGQRVSILFVDKFREYKEGIYRFQWSIVNRKNPDTYKIKLSNNNILVRIEQVEKIQSKYSKKTSLNDDKQLSNSQNERTTTKKDKEKMDIKSFASEQYALALENANNNGTCIEVELARNILDLMCEYGEISNYELCQFKKRQAMLTAYSYNEDLKSLDLFLFSKASTPTAKIGVDTVQDKYSNISNFYREALRNIPFFGAEVSEDAKNAIALIKEVRNNIQRVRLFFLTNGIVAPSPILNFSEENEYEHIFMEYSTWDISRVYRMNAINSGSEAIEIDFQLNYKTKIQCLRVEDENPKVDAYFAIMPGNILAKIYEQYKQTLLEGNVRLFLQKTNKVNRQICKTIKERPEMFFSFNNGISATAKHVEFGSGGSKAAPYITKITDLQIVNGGQTTASIASMQECDLSRVFVPMKISVIKDEQDYSEIVKEISTSANSQTYPKAQILEKADVAKCALLWEMKPYQACKSKEVVAVTYFSKMYEETEVKINGEYYRNIVSLYILYSYVNNYVKANFRSLFGTYSSRITNYVISSIAYLTDKKFNLDYIWKNNKVKSGLENIINQLAALINDHLFADFKPQYPKDEICWSELKAKLDDLADLRFKLLSFTERASEDSSATEGGKEELIEKVFTIPAPLWRAIAEWGKQTGKLSMTERMRALGYAEKRRSLIKLKTSEMAEKAIELEQKARMLGFSIKKND